MINFKSGWLSSINISLVFTLNIIEDDISTMFLVEAHPSCVLNILDIACRETLSSALWQRFLTIAQHLSRASEEAI